MQNSHYQQCNQVAKSYLPNPFPVHKLVIRKNTLKMIMSVKGWKTYTEVASALGFTRQYIAMIANGIPVTSEFITRMALALGNNNGNWYSHYEIAPRGEFDINHPVWNQQKHDGIIPYTRYSSSAELRSKDYSVERRYDFGF